MRQMNAWRVAQGVALGLLMATALIVSDGLPYPDPCLICDDMPWPDLCRLLNWCWLN